MADEEQVSPGEILRSAGADKPISEGTFLQRTGLILAAFVGGVGALVIVALIAKWTASAPAVPVIPPGSDAVTTKALLDNYQSLQRIALEPFTTLFDSVVVKVLVPIFTSILGYIFGSRENRN